MLITYKIHLIRHGLTQGNIEGRYIGVTDIPVCEEGFARLRELTEQYEYPTVGRVYTSPLLRCRQTAQVIYPDMPQQVVDDLIECNFGVFENMRVGEVKDDPRFLQWIEGGPDACPPGGGESANMIAARIERGLSTIFADMTRQKIDSAAVVTHGGVMMNLLKAFAFPRKKEYDWVVPNGQGYTIMMSAQMWMRDHAFEAIGYLPYGLSPMPDDFTNQNASALEEARQKAGVKDA